MPEVVHYRVSMSRPHSHLFEVEAHFPAGPDVLDAVLPVGQRPVDNAIRDQFSIGNNDSRAVHRPDNARSNPDPLDDADGIVDLDYVPDVYRSFEKQDHACDEITDDILQAETDTDTESADEYRNLCHVEPQHRHCDEKPDQKYDIVEHRRDRIW